MTPPVVAAPVAVSRFDKVATHRLTTLTGVTLALVGALMPPDVKSSCLNAVTNSTSPVFTSVLLIAGLGLTVLGPSLKDVDASVWWAKAVRHEEVENAKDEKE